MVQRPGGGARAQDTDKSVRIAADDETAKVVDRGAGGVAAGQSAHVDGAEQLHHGGDALPGQIKAAPRVGLFGDRGRVLERRFQLGGDVFMGREIRAKHPLIGACPDGGLGCCEMSFARHRRRGPQKLLQRQRGGAGFLLAQSCGDVGQSKVALLRAGQVCHGVYLRGGAKATKAFLNQVIERARLH